MFVSLARHRRGYWAARGEKAAPRVPDWVATPLAGPSAARYRSTALGGRVAPGTNDSQCLPRTCRMTCGMDHVEVLVGGRTTLVFKLGPVHGEWAGTVRGLKKIGTIAAIRFDIGFLSAGKERAATCGHIPFSHGKSRRTWPAGLDPNQSRRANLSDVAARSGRVSRAYGPFAGLIRRNFEFSRCRHQNKIGRTGRWRTRTRS